MGRPKGSTDTPLGIQAGVVVLHMLVGIDWKGISTMLKLDPLTAKIIWEKVQVRVIAA